MSLPIRLSSRFEQDVARQTQWYLARAGAAVALEFGDKVDSTLQRLGQFPESGAFQKGARQAIRRVLN